MAIILAIAAVFGLLTWFNVALGVWILLLFTLRGHGAITTMILYWVFFALAFLLGRIFKWRRMTDQQKAPYKTPGSHASKHGTRAHTKPAEWKLP